MDALASSLMGTPTFRRGGRGPVDGEGVVRSAGLYRQPEERTSPRCDKAGGDFRTMLPNPSPRPPPRSGEGEKDKYCSPSSCRGGCRWEGLGPVSLPCQLFRAPLV